MASKPHSLPALPAACLDGGGGRLKIWGVGRQFFWLAAGTQWLALALMSAVFVGGGGSQRGQVAAGCTHPFLSGPVLCWAVLVPLDAVEMIAAACCCWGGWP